VILETVEMNLLAALLLSHLVADFPLQTNRIYKLKNESGLGIALHAAIHVILAAFLIKQPLTVWPLLVVLGMLHFLIDLVKVRMPQKPQSIGFLIDQIAHIIVLKGLADRWANTTGSVLSLSILMPMIIYGIFIAILVFLWVLANDLAMSEISHKSYVQWTKNYLLQVSQYAGWPLVFSLVVYWYNSSSPAV